MPLNRIDWVRNFDVSSPKRNCQGQIVYKVTSVVYPRNAPEAVTKLVVWRCSNDFEALFLKMKEISARKGINLTYNFDTSQEFFQSAKKLLTFIGNYPCLFLSDNFQNFFQSEFSAEAMYLSVNNNLVDKENVQPIEEDFVIVDKPEEKSIGIPEVEEDTENSDVAGVLCHSEKPVNCYYAELMRYRVVNLLDKESRVFLVRRDDKPGRKYVLKVLRKNWWREEQNRTVPPPTPIPYMARLVQFIETSDAVFEVTEFVSGGRLFDHLTENLNSASPKEIDDLVANSQRLLASVSRTLSQSERATTSLQENLANVEMALKKGSKACRRSQSASARRKWDKYLSSDDLSGLMKSRRTPQSSLDRASEVPSRILEKPRVSECNFRIWATQLVCALSALHQNGVIFRDLNPKNLLLDDRGNLLMTFHHQWQGFERPISQKAINRLYAAPEVRKIGPLTPACDWWSLGALFYELLTGMALAEVHPNGFEPYTCLQVPDFLSVEASSLLKELLQYEPIERLGAGLNGSEDVKCHPFFNAVDWFEVSNAL